MLSTTSVELKWGSVINQSGCEVQNLKVVWSNADAEELVNESVLLASSASNYTISGLTGLSSYYRVALSAETAISWTEG